MIPSCDDYNLLPVEFINKAELARLRRIEEAARELYQWLDPRDYEPEDSLSEICDAYSKLREALEAK